MMAKLYKVRFEDDEGEFDAGYMLRTTAEKLIAAPVSVRGEVAVDEAAGTIRLFHGGPTTEPERTALIAKLTQHWRDTGAFRILLRWRDEPWPVYGRRGKLLFSMERSATGLLGIMRYGVHLTAYVRDDSVPHGMRFWVPQRAGGKSTYPSMLDNTVAGGLTTGEDPFECIIREADEEASLPDALVRGHAKEVGTISYIQITDERAGGERGLIYPECQWIYDLELPRDVVPEPKDGEVARFDLLTVDEVREKLAQGRFKPNCALVLLDFFIRHNIITSENEPDLEEIKRRIHRKCPFPGPDRAPFVV